MIFALGQFDADLLINDFIAMASDQNEKHEKNIYKVFKHGDGWGIAYLQNDSFQIFRSPKPVYEDPQLEQFRDVKTNFLILHARKASKGEVVLENVHPFEAKLNSNHYLFFHNGTIRDNIQFDKCFQPIGATDSERLFYYLMTGSKGQIDENRLSSKLLKIKDYTAANFILTNGKITFTTSWYSENPNYYTLKVLKKSDGVIVASEVLPHYSKENWKKLDNYDIVKVISSNFDLKISKRNEY